jgi:hypothetical protein
VKHKTLFRLLLKFLGVWLTANGIVSLVSTITNVIAMTFFRPTGVSYSYPYWISLLNGIVGIALGLYLFFGGKRIVDLAIPSNRPYCHECGYDLTGAVGNVCNECGTPFRAASSAAMPPPAPALTAEGISKHE